MSELILRSPPHMTNNDLKAMLFSLLGLFTVAVLGIALITQSVNLAWTIVLLVWVVGAGLMGFRIGIVLGLSLMLFTSFFNRVTYNFEDVNFQFLFAFPDLVTFTLMAMWLLQFMGSGRSKVRVHLSLDRWVLLYTIVAFAQVFNPTTSIIVGLYGARAELLPLCMYFISRYYFHTIKDVNRFYRLFIILGNIVVAYALFQHIWDLPYFEQAWLRAHPGIWAQKTLSVGKSMGWYTNGKLRVFSSLNGSHEFNFLMVMFFILFVVYNPLKRILWRIARLLFLANYTAFLALTLERMPIAMITLGLLAAFIIRGPFKHKRTFALIVIAVILVGSLYMMLVLGQDYFLRMVGDNLRLRRLVQTLTPFSAVEVRAGRFHHWENTFRLVIDNPAGYGLGSGLANRATQMGRNALEEPHNYFLRIALETGVPGLVLFVIVIAQLIRIAMHKMPQVCENTRLLLRALVGVIVAIVACGFFNNPLLISVGYYFWFLMGSIPALLMNQGGIYA